MICTGHWMLRLGEWNFQKRLSNNYTYSVGDVDKHGEILNSTNDVNVDFRTRNVTWENKTPYCVVLVNDGTLEKRYIDPDSDFCVFIINNKKAVVIDKKFENSIFNKLVIEKSNSKVFKPLYQIRVWLFGKFKRNFSRKLS